MAVKDISNRSKRFFSGSIHEIQGGRIKILNRFLGEDEKTVMLRYEIIQTGQIIVNKEANVAASIYKFNRLKRESLANGDERYAKRDKSSFTQSIEPQVSETEVTTLKDVEVSLQRVFTEVITKLNEVANSHQESLSSDVRLYDDVNKLTGKVDDMLEKYITQQQYLEFIRFQQETIHKQQEIIESLTNKMLHI